MTNRSRAATRQLWDDRIKRFKSSDQTVAQFCAAEGCSQASFYQWRRKLRPERQQPESPTPQSLAAFVPVKLPTRAADEIAPISPPATVLSVDLPGGIRVRLEVSGDNQASAGDQVLS